MEMGRIKNDDEGGGRMTVHDTLRLPLLRSPFAQADGEYSAKRVVPLPLRGSCLEWHGLPLVSAVS